MIGLYFVYVMRTLVELRDQSVTLFMWSRFFFWNVFTSQSIARQIWNIWWCIQILTINNYYAELSRTFLRNLHWNSTLSLRLNSMSCPRSSRDINQNHHTTWYAGFDTKTIQILSQLPVITNIPPLNMHTYQT